MEKYSCYEYQIKHMETGEKRYSSFSSTGECRGYKVKYVYEIYSEGCPPYDNGLIESDEWFDTENDAELAVKEHISLLENGQ